MVERKPSWSLRRGHICRWDYHCHYHGRKKSFGERRTSARNFRESRGKGFKVVSPSTHSPTQYLSDGIKLGCERNSLVGFKFVGAHTVQSLITLQMVTVQKKIVSFLFLEY